MGTTARETTRRARIAASAGIAVLAIVGASQSARAGTIEIEREVYHQINDIRVANGLNPVIYSEDLAPAARWHSQDQARRRCIAHIDSLGRNAGDRLDDIRVPWLRYGENVGYVWGYDDPCTTVVRAWLASPGHAANLLDPRLVESAVGVAQSADGTYYLTQVFVTR